MASAVDLIERVRRYGANLAVNDDGSLRIVNAKKLPPGAKGFIQKHRQAIVSALRSGAGEAFEERAAIIEFDGGAPREWAEQFALLLTSRRPAGVDDLSWSWFLTTCGKIIDAAPTSAGTR